MILSDEIREQLKDVLEVPNVPMELNSSSLRMLLEEKIEEQEVSIRQGILETQEVSKTQCLQYAKTYNMYNSLMKILTT